MENMKKFSVMGSFVGVQIRVELNDKKFEYINQKYLIVYVSYFEVCQFIQYILRVYIIDIRVIMGKSFFKVIKIYKY